MCLRRSWLLLGAWLLTRAVGDATPASTNELRVGDVLTADLIAPAPLVVVNPEATAELRAREAQRVPAVFVFDPRVAETAAARLQEAFERARSRFVQRLEEAFRATPLSANAVESPRFHRFLGNYLRQARPAFPVTTNLAQRWAQGDSGETELAMLQRHLAAVMERPIRADALPRDIKLGAQVRVIPSVGTVTNSGDPASVTARLLARSNLLTVTRARAELQQAFPPEASATAKFLAGFIQANCVVDAVETRRLRAEHVEPLCVVDRYARGEVIAQAGQVVDARVLAAWQQLRELAVHMPPPAPERQHPPGVWEAWWPPPGWLLGALVVTALGLGGWLWRLLTARPTPTLLPARLEDAGWPETAADAAQWQRRAWLAEQRAARVTAGVKAGLMVQLADFLKAGWAQAMWRQRDELLRAQQHAAREVAGLTARLDQLQAPLAERLRAYEARIAELERELAQQDAANRELIRATIALVRRQLETEREHPPLRWN